MHISSNFDGGNIEVVSAASADDIQLHISKDNQSEFYQWFYFRLSGVNKQQCKIAITNAGGAAYPEGFENYRVVYSYDRQDWRRHPTTMNSGVLQFNFTAEKDSVFFAYFAPYSIERHYDLIARASQSDACSSRVLGQSLDGQDLDYLRFASVNSPTPTKNCWIIARQHPGETMAQWWMEGFIDRLCDPEDEGAQQLLQHTVIHLVPNMNPDGSRRGHLRTNAAGKNLNREWQSPTMRYSPEVFLVKQAISETGVDVFLDVHGDEALPYCFIAGTEGLSQWNKPAQQKLDYYKNELATLNPDFQTKEGYPAKSPGQANMTMSTTQIANLYGALAMTLEMPFKDTVETPNPSHGWSPARCKTLAHSCLDALASYLTTLDND